MPKPEPIVTMMIDQRILFAKCSECDEPLDLSVTVGSAEEQESSCTLHSRSTWMQSMVASRPANRANPNGLHQTVPA